MFRAAYADIVPPMPDRTDWPQVELEYKLLPPKQKRAAGRPRVVRIRGSAEQRANRKKKLDAEGAKALGTLPRPVS